MADKDLGEVMAEAIEKVPLDRLRRYMHKVALLVESMPEGLRPLVTKMLLQQLAFDEKLSHDEFVAMCRDLDAGGRGVAEAAGSARKDD